MSPALNGSSALQRFECGNMVEIRNVIMFDFYPGLTHTYMCMAHNIPLMGCINMKDIRMMPMMA